MNEAILHEPRVLHALPGRLRAHLPAWPAAGPPEVERRVRRVPGVLRVEANPLTGNVLIHFDPGRIDVRTLRVNLGGDGQPAAALLGGEPRATVPPEDGDE